MKPAFPAFLNWWFWLSSPSPDEAQDTIPAQEQLRRAYLLSALLPLIVIAVLLSIPNALKNPVLWVPLITISGLGIFSALLNRVGWGTAASLLYVFAIDLSVTLTIVAQPYGIANNNLPDFDIFSLSVLIGGLILARNYILFIGFTNISLILAIFLLVPHDRLLVEEINLHQGGLAYSSLTDALLLQMCAIIIAWLSSWSVTRALQRANRAEELAQARAQISEQALAITTQKQRLEDGITHILETHRQIAAGNFHVRAPMEDEHELWQISRSLNTLLGRLQQQARESQELAATRHDIEHISAALLARRPGERVRYPRCTSPLGQLLLKALQRDI